MRRMLDPKEAGGSLPSTVEFDKEGNRTVKKNLGVDGKLTLKSLVSASNPDGDITKELGGGGSTRHAYRVFCKSNIYYLVYTNKDYPLEIGSSIDVPDFTTNSNYQELRKNGYYPAGGYYKPLSMSATIVNIINDVFQLWGNTGTDNQFSVNTIEMSDNITITKLY